MINKKRIGNPKKYLNTVLEVDDSFFVAIPFEVYKESAHLKDYELTETFFENLEQMPNGIKATSISNKIGKFRNKLPLEVEIITKNVSYKVTDWHKKEHEGFCDRTYKRYKKELVHHYKLSLKFVKNDIGELYVILPNLIYSDTIDNLLLVKHSFNLMLELFKQCEILDKDMHKAIFYDTTFNWEMLPSGEINKDDIEILCDRMFEKKDKKIEELKAFKERVKYLEEFNPNLRAIGKKGFHGYIAYGFPNSNSYVLESIYNNNATYVFDENWKALSMQDKQTVLKKGLHKKRIYHERKWKENIRNIIQ